MRLVLAAAILPLTAASLIGGATFAADSSKAVLDHHVAQMKAGSRVTLPREHAERGAMVVGGEVAAGGARHGDGAMIVFDPGETAEIEAATDARVMLLGGAPLDGPRHVWWNFVSSAPERLEKAKSDWKDGRFARIPGDDAEFIPLPS